MFTTGNCISKENLAQELRINCPTVHKISLKFFIMDVSGMGDQMHRKFNGKIHFLGSAINILLSIIILRSAS